MIQNPNAIGAAPAPGNPTAPQAQKLPPQAMVALRKSPDIMKAVALFMGRPVPMQSIPDNLLVEIAGMVHKLGVQGAVQKFQQTVPPQVQAQLKASAQPQGQQMPPQGPPQ